MDAAALIDDIYEAAVVPDRWVGVLDKIAAAADGEGTMMFAGTRAGVRWLASPKIFEAIARWANSDWSGSRNTRGQRLIPIREPRFLTDLDAFTPEELETDPYYTEFLRPQGFGWCVGTSIHAPAGDTLVFSVEKAYAKGPVPRRIARALDQYRPHLARAALIAARVGLDRARATVETFDVIGYPAAVLTQSGRAIAVNSLFQTCAPALAIGALDKVLFARPLTHTLFVDALEAVRAASSSYTGRSIPIAGGKLHGPMIAHVVPLRREARDIFSGAFSILCVTPVTLQRAPHRVLLEALFDLTPAEAKVAGLLVEGRTVSGIARAQRVTEHTIRMQLKAVFAKTGVHRQAELVSLLSLPSFGDSRSKR